MDKCKWVFEGEYDGHWSTSCAHKYIIMEGTPEENNMKYCTFCGNEIEQIEEARGEE